MELRIYNQTEETAKEPRWRAWLRRRLPWVEEFEQWAAPEAEPEQEQERSFLPVALLLGAALVAQYAQFSIPAVSAFLRDQDTFYRLHWMVFTVLKQWGLFVLMLVAIHLKEGKLSEIGFPQMSARRTTLAIVLVGFFLGAALLRSPGAEVSWLTPVVPLERVLSLALALTAAVVEETLFRGFAIVWTYRWSGNLLLAVLFPAIVFTAGHAYLGVVNLGFAFLVTIVFSVFFLWKRDLYWLMVVHFLIDVADLLS